MKVNPKFKLLVYVAFLTFILVMLGIWYSGVNFWGNLYIRDCAEVKMCGSADISLRKEYFPDVSFKNCIGIFSISNKCKYENLPVVEEVTAWKAYVLPVNSTVVRSNVVGVGWWSYPDDIVEITADPNDLLILVNKKYKLPSTYAPSGLINLGDSGVRNGGHYLGRAVILGDLKALGDAARVDGVDIAIKSAYRSYSTQTATYNSWLSKYNYNYDLVDTFSARAGHSQHQLGTTIDFTTNECNDSIGNVFNSTQASVWLSENAWKYGFVISYPIGVETITGFKYEGWHYRYIGVENARLWKESGLVLDQFLALQDVNQSFIAIP